MNIITDSETLKQHFKEHLENNEKFYCCVAWVGAPHSFDGIKLIESKKNRDKIEKMIVGTHFYQTSPEFIAKFRNHKKVKFIRDTDGVFHSKIYLFKNSDKHWKAIIGSSNFTKGGFEKNTECNVEIESGDNPTGLLLKQIEDHINLNWANGKQFTEQDLARYIEAYKKQKPKLDSLAKSYHATKHSYIANEFSLGSWEEYVDKLENSLVEFKGTLMKLKGSDVLKDRINILTTIHSWFATGIPFSEMDYEKRKCIAGLVETQDLDWRFFGSTGNGKFMHIIKDDTAVRFISNALDKIPLEGEVTKEMFNVYITEFRKQWKRPLASATRLLAMKRPDIFICVNGRNKKGLSKMLGIPESHINTENYWDCVVNPFLSSEWKAQGKDNPLGQEYYPYRIALLDALFYKEDEKKNK